MIDISVPGAPAEGTQQVSQPAAEPATPPPMEPVTVEPAPSFEPTQNLAEQVQAAETPTEGPQVDAGTQRAFDFQSTMDQEATALLERFKPSEDEVALRVRGSEPQAAYENVRLADRAGLDQELVASNPQLIRDDLDMADTSDQLRGYDEAIRWSVQSPESAKVAREKWSDITAISGYSMAFREARDAAVEGAHNFSRGFEQGRLVAEVGMAYYKDPTSERSQVLNARCTEFNDSLTPEETDSVLFDVGQFLGTSAQSGQAFFRGAAPALAVAAPLAAIPGVNIAAGGVAGFTAALGVFNAAREIEQGMWMRDALARGVPMETAQNYGKLVGSLSGALELASGVVSVGAARPFFAPLVNEIKRRATSTLTRNLLVAEGLQRRTVAGALGRAAGGMAVGATGEATTEAFQDTIGAIADDYANIATGLQEQGRLDTPEGRQELLDQAQETFAKTWRAALVMGGAAAAVGLPSNIRAARRSAQAQQEYAHALNEGKANSELGKKYPVVMDQYEEHSLAENGVTDVYVDNVAFAQAMNDAHVTLEDLGQVDADLAAAVKTASDEGGDVLIPAQSYVRNVAGTDLGYALERHVRFTEDGLSIAEVEQGMKDAQAIFAQAEKEVNSPEALEAVKTRRAELEEIYNDVRDSLVKTGMDRKQASSNALLMRNFYDVMSDRMETSPLEFYAQYAPTIRSANAEGVRGSYAPGSNTITLTPKADASTFLHETGHYFLNTFMDLAGSERATEQMRADAQAVCDWFGVKSADDWRAMTSKEQEKFHEQFAYNFEQYLFEGKAPTGRMRALFERFATWLKKVYLDLRRETNALYKKQFGEDLPELSDEVRLMMDRLIATDRAVENAVMARRLEPIVARRDRGGMSEAEWNEYLQTRKDSVDEAQASLRVRTLREARRLTSRIDAERRKAAARARDKRAELKKRFRDEIRLEPVYRARHFLQTGEMLDDKGNVVGRFENHRLRASDNFGKNKKITNLTARKGGLSADEVASYFGYSSGRELVQELSDRPSLNEAVDARVEQTMAEEFFALEDPDAVNQAVAEAVASEGFTRMIAAEYKALQNANQPARVIAQYAKETAARILGRTPFKDVNPTRYTTAEAKSRRRAERAMAQGDLKLAVEFKRQELLNHELARQAREAAALRERLTKIRRDAFRPNSKVAKTRDMDYVNMVRAILDRFGMATEAQSRTILDTLRTLESVDPDGALAIKDAVSGVEAAVGGRRGAELTFNDVRSIYETVAGIWSLSRSAMTNLVDGQRLERQSLQAELVQQLSQTMDNGKRRLVAGNELTGNQTLGYKVRSMLLGLNAVSRRMESWCRAMDGGQRGVFTKYLFEPILDATTAFRSRKQQVLSELQDIMKGIDFTDQRIATPELSNEKYPRLPLTKAQVLHAILHTGNSSNKKKLLLGYGWGEVHVNPITGEEVLDSSRWDRFMARMAQEGVITKEDMDRIQRIWDLMEEIKPEAQKAHKEIYGYNFSEVTAEPVATPWGIYRGGYAPAIVDPSLVSDGSQRKSMEEQLDMVSDSFMMPIAPNGFTKQRVDNYTKPLLLDLTLLMGHVDKVLRFAYLAPRVREVYRLIGDEHSPVVKLLNSYDPHIVQSMIIPWLSRTQGQYVSKPGDVTKFSKHLDNLLRGLRTNASLGAMAGNLLNAVQQYTGVSIAASRVSKRALVRAVMQTTSSPRESRRFVLEHSQWMRQRMESNLFELSGELENLTLPKTKYRSAKQFITQHAYFLQQHAQNTMDVPVWMAAYTDAIEQGRTEADAVRHADSVIRETQGSFNPEDISRVEAGSPAARLLTMFYSFFNMQYNLVATEMGQAWVKRKYGRMAYVYFTAIALPAVLSEALMSAAGGVDAGDDGEFDGLDVLRMSANALAANTISMLPWGSTIFNPLLGIGNTSRLTISPAASTLESIMGGLGEWFNAMDESEEVDARRAVRGTITGIGLLTGWPIGQLAKPFGYAAGVFDGQISPDTTSDLIRGLVTGRDVNQ